MADDVPQEQDLTNMKFTVLTLYIKLVFQEAGKDLPDVKNMTVERRGVNQSIVNVHYVEFAQQVPQHITV